MQKKIVQKIKRPVHSFRPKDSFITPKILHFRGDGAKDIGTEEITFPPIEEQNKWTQTQYEDILGKALNWYNLTQETKKVSEFAYVALHQGNDRRKISEKLRKSTEELSPTCCWILRAAHMGLKLSWRNKKFLARHIKKCINAVEAKQASGQPDTLTKPNIQDRIEAKLRQTMGQVEAAFDDALNNKFKTQHTVMSLLLNPDVAPPGNRYKDLIRMAEPRLAELKLAQTGKDEQLVEGYSTYGKRGLANMVEWWEQTISDFNSYGLVKKSSRKAKRRKTTTPEKIVSKLKYMKDCPALKLQSVDPRIILQSTVLWVYNVRTRKLGVYIADKRSSALDVRSTRILNFDPVISIQKTLRKPEQQLAQFAAMGKPAAMKWFDTIKATEIKLKSGLNKDSILLKTFK